MSERVSQDGLGERIFAGAVGLIFAGQFLMALKYPSDPRLFPLIVSAAGFMLSVALALGVGLHDHLLGPPEVLPKARLTLTLAVSPIYAFGLWFLGYWIATIIAIPTIAWLLGYRNKPILVLVTFGVALALGVIFPLLDVPLPVGFLRELISF
jgi:hypothetical protein